PKTAKQAPAIVDVIAMDELPALDGSCATVVSPPVVPGPAAVMSEPRSTTFPILISSPPDAKAALRERSGKNLFVSLGKNEQKRRRSAADLQVAALRVPERLLRLSTHERLGN
ncbi:unnamed protein product, partial [Phaeothamnion confervicola]